MDVNSDTAFISRIKAAEEKMIRMETKAEERMTKMETKFDSKLTSILQALEQLGGGKETRTNVPNVELPDEHQDED